MIGKKNISFQIGCGDLAVLVLMENKINLKWIENLNFVFMRYLGVIIFSLFTIHLSFENCQFFS